MNMHLIILQQINKKATLKRYMTENKIGIVKYGKGKMTLNDGDPNSNEKMED